MTDDHALRAVRRLSRPFMILLTIALGLVVLVQGAEVLAILVFQGGGDWHAWVASSANGIGLSIGGSRDQPAGVALDSLSFAQRSELALLAALCATGSGLMLFHLRQLFALYSRGEVFTGDNIRHIKRFGLWLAAAAIMINVADRLFPMITGAPPQGFANAVMAIVFGGMTWVIARVMELGREADQERREFI